MPKEIPLYASILANFRGLTLTSITVSWFCWLRQVLTDPLSIFNFHAPYSSTNSNSLKTWTSITSFSFDISKRHSNILNTLTTATGRKTKKKSLNYKKRIFFFVYINPTSISRKLLSLRKYFKRFFSIWNKRKNKDGFWKFWTGLEKVKSTFVFHILKAPFTFSLFL